MKKKTYQKPSIKVNALALGNAILTGSDVTVNFDNENIIENGTLEARRGILFETWEEDE